MAQVGVPVQVRGGVAEAPLSLGAIYIVALEGALQLNEITYAHCEDILSTEFKHGLLTTVIKAPPHYFRVRWQRRATHH